MKKLGVLSLVLIALLCMLGSVPVAAAPTTVKYGLTAAADGTVMMDGKPFYGYGANGYMLVSQQFVDPFYDYEEAFVTLKKYNIPFVRMALCGETVDAINMYLEEPEIYFSFIDRTIALAEKYNVGIIADMCWGYAYVNGLFGEQAYKIGDTSSKSYKFAVRYAEDIVKRYKNSPAIWGWEISNELNLMCDLYGDAGWVPTAFGEARPAKPNGYDHITGREVQTLIKGVSAAIRKYDTYRIISNGNGIVRGNAKNLLKASDNMKNDHTWTVSWEADTLEEFYEMNEFFCPDPCNTYSMHIANGDDSGYVSMEWDVWGKTGVTYKEYLESYVTAAKKAKKALFFGEFGSFEGITFKPEYFETNKSTFKKIVSDMKAADIRFAALWMFAFDEMGVRHIRDDNNMYSFMLGELQKENKAFQSAGKQPVANYWGKAKPVFNKSQTTTTTTTTGKTTTTQQKNTDVTTTVHNTTAPTEGTTSNVTLALSQYMISRYARLKIDEATNVIHIQTSFDVDLFTRSIALRDGYTMTLVDGTGQTVTEPTASITADFQAIICDPDGREVRRLTVEVEQSVKGNEEPAGFSIWGWILIGAGALIMVTGGVVLAIVLRKHSKDVEASQRGVT